MRTRIVAGVSAALVVIGLVARGPVILILAVVLVCAAIAYLEFDRLFFFPTQKIRQLRLISLTLVTIVAMAQHVYWGWIGFWFSFVFICLTHVVNSNRTGDFQNESRELSLEFLGLVYVVSLLGFIVPIINTPHGRGYLLLLFLIVFLGDTAAYFVGSQFGKHPLAPKLSPKKTIEGAVGALIVSIVVTWIWHYFIFEAPAPRVTIKLLIFAPLGSLLAQGGDLFESLFKRSQSQKDSGHFLPGHGGLLDRIDGLALVSPVYYIFLKVIMAQ
jgi:phosphatidate cytidylyltransferase